MRRNNGYRFQKIFLFSINEWFLRGMKSNISKREKIFENILKLSFKIHHFIFQIRSLS